jgi:multidrug resistance efflux pump
LDEIHNYTAAWYVRWGGALVLVLLAVVGVAGSLVRYPEVVRARVTLSTKLVAVRVSVPAGRRVERVLVQENQKVEAGTPLIVLESAAAYDDVQRVSAWLHAAALNNGAATLPPMPERVSLGLAQAEYIALQDRVEKWVSLHRDPFRAELVQALRRQLAARDRTRDVLREQRRAAGDAQEIAQAQMARERGLVERMAASADGLDRARAQSVDHEIRVLQAEASVAAADVERAQVEQEVLRIRHEAQAEAELARQAVLAAARALRGAIERWDAEHVLRAPTRGVATFIEPLQRGRVFESAREVVAVAPQGQPVEGTMFIPESGIGRVHPGMRVRIALTSYPSREFGSVVGRIRHIGMVAGPDGYLATLELPQGLRTGFGRAVGFRQQMSGDGEIIVGETTLLGRFVGSLKLARERHLGREVDGEAPASETAGQHE